MSDKERNDNTTLFAIAILGLGVLLVSYWEKHKYQFFRWYLDHRLTIAAVLAFAIWVSGVFAYSRIRKKYLAYKEDKSIVDGSRPDSCFMGFDEKGRKVFLDISQLITHADTVGTTKAGKSESIIFPL